jgi:type II secretory pathway predicted ATPase ExeA
MHRNCRVRMHWTGRRHRYLRHVHECVGGDGGGVVVVVNIGSNKRELYGRK